MEMVSQNDVIIEIGEEISICGGYFSFFDIRKISLKYLNYLFG